MGGPEEPRDLGIERLLRHLKKPVFESREEFDEFRGIGAEVDEMVLKAKILCDDPDASLERYVHHLNPQEKEGDEEIPDEELEPAKTRVKTLDSLSDAVKAVEEFRQSVGKQDMSSQNILSQYRGLKDRLAHAIAEVEQFIPSPD